jgi:hypothetical protein
MLRVWGNRGKSAFEDLAPTLPKSRFATFLATGAAKFDVKANLIAQMYCVPPDANHSGEDSVVARTRQSLINRLRTGCEDGGVGDIMMIP